MNLLLIFGGSSTEHEISRASCGNIYDSLDKSKYTVHLIYITRQGEWKYLSDPTVPTIKRGNLEGRRVVLSPDTSDRGIVLLDTLETIKIDCIFPVLHGKNGEDGTIQGLFELARIPYVGCDVLSSANSMDKSLTKIIVKGEGVQQSPYVLILANNYEENVKIKEIESVFAYPVFVKPSSSGSSVGVTKATNQDELKEAIVFAFKYDKKVIVEKFVQGREVEVAVIGNEKPVASITGEIRTNTDFYSFDSKYIGSNSQVIIPAEITEKTSEVIRQRAIKVYKTLGCRGLARVDFFVTPDEQVIFNEINTMPGFTNISMYPKLFENMGISYSKLLDKLIEFALKRGDDIG
ncbi:MAG: D-alanine--D-alanine ligase family protein [Clostridia bacterium]